MVAQLDTNLCSHVGQIVGVVNSKGTPASQFRNFSQQCRTEALLFRGEIVVVNADRIDEHVGLFGERLDLSFRVTAVVVPTIGYDQQRLLREFRLPHFADPQVNGIQQRRAAFGHCVHQFPLDLLDRLREIRDLLRFIGKCDHEKFVLRVGGLEELHNRFARPLDLAAHAAAHVEDHAQRNRSILAGECLDRLCLFALE